MSAVHRPRYSLGRDEEQELRAMHARLISYYRKAMTAGQTARASATAAAIKLARAQLPALAARRA